MRFLSSCALVALVSFQASAQTLNQSAAAQANNNSGNIYAIKQQFLEKVLHNPTPEEETEDDNELERFNRWFHLVEPRCYPSGNLPAPDAQLRAYMAEHRAGKPAHKTATGSTGWQPVGPKKVPINNNGIGRINCIVIDPVDTNTLYIGAACGGVYISHDGGTTWTSNSDNFPSLSIADIVVNPNHTDTIYAATGDGYGYENGVYNIFWGGLYSAGVMKSTDGGNSWSTTGLSFIQSDNNIIQRLLIHPNNPNILLAATRHGMLRTTDAGATWDTVDAGHIYTMAFLPGSPDTIYSISNMDLRVSYDAGATWHLRHTGINPTNDRATLAISPITPRTIWLLDADEILHRSDNGGTTFTTVTSPNDTANFYGYYDRVLTVSHTDPNFVLAFGMIMARSVDGGMGWFKLDQTGDVHVDNHAVAMNPYNNTTIYTGNDGGISVTHDGGASWRNLSNGLMISQIYRMGSSLQDPYLMVAGLQDNGTFRYDGTNWSHKVGGDGMDCAIHPLDDNLQIASYQNGNFYISYNKGADFNKLNITSEQGSWTAPVALDPANESIMFFGYKNIYASYDEGVNFVGLTTNSPFPDGAVSLAVAPSNDSVIYAADYGKIMRTVNSGATWSNVTGSLPVWSVAITHIAVDPTDPMHIYVSVSGYTPGDKVYSSATGGVTWTNISGALPNIPANCIAVDTSTPGALFVGTDLGVYYMDAANPTWTLYSSGLPNVIVDGLDINYNNYMIRAATYGRGIWETSLVKPAPDRVSRIPSPETGIDIYPNPTTGSWKISFGKSKPASFTVQVSDLNGRTLLTEENCDQVDASGLVPGVYNLDVISGGNHTVTRVIRR